MMVVVLWVHQEITLAKAGAASSCDVAKQM